MGVDMSPSSRKWVTRSFESTCAQHLYEEDKRICDEQIKRLQELIWEFRHNGSLTDDLNETIDTIHFLAAQLNDAIETVQRLEQDIKESEENAHVRLLCR